MEGTYPVMIDGAVVGRCQVRRQGARTEFDVCCRMMEGIVRLSVYGQEGEGYLGIPIPEEGELRLRKVFSPAAVRDFPGEIIEIGPAGRGKAAMTVLPEETAAEEASEAEEATETVCQAEGTENVEEVDEDALYWYSSPDGALVCFDGARSLIALPLEDERIPPNIQGQLRQIEGKEYLVYVTKNSRIEL